MAELAKAPAEWVWPAPDGVELSKCANLSRNYVSAYHSLKVVGEIKKGDLVLVDGASGGVGLAAIELARAMGAKVIAGVSSEAKIPFPQEAGADRVLCYGRDKASFREFKQQVKQAATELGHPAGVDAVIDPDQHRRNVQEILGFLESGAVNPRVDRVFAFEDFLMAFELYEQNRGRGNTVVRING